MGPYCTTLSCDVCSTRWKRINFPFCHDGTVPYDVHTQVRFPSCINLHYTLKTPPLPLHGIVLQGGVGETSTNAPFQGVSFVALLQCLCTLLLVKAIAGVLCWLRYAKYFSVSFLLKLLFISVGEMEKSVSTHCSFRK